MALRGDKRQLSLQDHRQALAAVRNELPGAIMAVGESEYLRAEALDVFRQAWLEKYPDGDLALIRGAGEARPATLSDITRELAGGSLFAREKLVLVRQAERLLFPRSGSSGDEEEAETPGAGNDRAKAFLDRLDNPSPLTWLAMESASLPKNRILGKRLAAACVVIPCPQPTPRDIPVWLSDRAEKAGKTMDHEAMDLLSRAHGADLGVLAREVDKLALFAGEGGRIDAAMVGEFLTGTIEFDIFSLTNAFEARDAGKALHFARRIALQGTRDQRGKREDGEKSAHKVLSMLAGTIQGLLRARVALAERRDAGDFAAAEKLSPWRASKLLEAASRFDLRELRVMAGEAAEQLRRVHDTGGDVLLALELMAVKLTGG